MQNYPLQTRKVVEDQQRAKKEAEEREMYETFLAQMIFELSEVTALVFYPWVFKEEGRHRDKYQCPPYLELINTLFRQNFDVLEELRVQLNEETIEKMFVESNVEITKELVAGDFLNSSISPSKLSLFITEIYYTQLSLRINVLYESSVVTFCFYILSNFIELFINSLIVSI